MTTNTLVTAQSLEQWSFKVTGGGTEPFVIENYDKMQEAFNEYSKQFATMGIDSNNLGEAKKTKALLNKIKKTFNDRRIEIARTYNDNLKGLKKQVDDLTEIFDESIDHINFNVRMYDHQEQNKREAALNELVQEMKPNFDFDMANWVPDPKWLNKGMFTSLNKPSKKLVEAVSEGMKVLQDQKQERERSIDLVKTMATMNHLDPAGWVAMVDSGLTQQDIVNRMQRTVKQRETVQVEPVDHKKTVDLETGEIQEEPVRRFNFSVNVTETQRQQLLNFMRQNDIVYEVQEG